MQLLSVFQRHFDIWVMHEAIEKEGEKSRWAGAEQKGSEAVFNPTSLETARVGILIILVCHTLPDLY